MHGHVAFEPLRAARGARSLRASRGAAAFAAMICALVACVPEFQPAPDEIALQSDAGRETGSKADSSTPDAGPCVTFAVGFPNLDSAKWVLGGDVVPKPSTAAAGLDFSAAQVRVDQTNPASFYRTRIGSADTANAGMETITVRGSFRIAEYASTANLIVPIVVGFSGLKDEYASSYLAVNRAAVNAPVALFQGQYSSVGWFPALPGRNSVDFQSLQAPIVADPAKSYTFVVNLRRSSNKWIQTVSLGGEELHLPGEASEWGFVPRGIQLSFGIAEASVGDVAGAQARITWTDLSVLACTGSGL